MGILAQSSYDQNCIKSTNKIPEYARDYKKEYLFIIGINKEFKYILDNLDNLNSGLFESDRVNRIMKIIKRFLKGQERGKLRDISGIVFNEYEVNNIIKIKKNFSLFKLRYDFCIEGDDAFNPYPGFGNIYDIFELFFSKINIKYDSDSDSYSDSDFDDIEINYYDSDSDD